MKEQLLVGIDVGCHEHRVAIAQSSGDILKEFGISHTASGFHPLYYELEHKESALKLPVVIEIEGFNRYA